MVCCPQGFRKHTSHVAWIAVFTILFAVCARGVDVEGTFDPLASARSLNECKPLVRRWTEAVIDQHRRFVYIDNKKAGTTTTMRKLERALNVNWRAPDETLWKKPSECDASAPVCIHNGCLIHANRTTTGCLDARNLVREDYVVFSFVREPVAKYISGIGQNIGNAGKARAYNTTMSEYRRIEYWRKSNRTSWSFGPEDHTATNTWRLGSSDRRHEPIPLTFVGRVEHYDEDMRRLLDVLRDRLSSAERASLLEPLVERQGASQTTLKYFHTLESQKALTSSQLNGMVECLPPIEKDYECLDTVYRRPAGRVCPPDGKQPRR